jgi:hypothetical protein
MHSTLKFVKTLTVLLGLLVLAACSPAQTPAAPTVDPVSIRTEAAATVLAQVTRDLALTPSATLPPTLTATLAPSDTPTTSPTSPAATLTLTATQTITGTSNLSNLARWVSQSIPDGTNFLPGETFTMTWQVQNAGEATWTTGYWLRFYAGNTFGAPTEVPLGKEVLPDQIVEITLRMRAPTQPGEYRSNWVLANEARSNFKDGLFLVIVVPAPTATPTRTPRPSATPQPTATP